jgi:glycosyltransferase involved in cell wall biosynthesis
MRLLMVSGDTGAVQGVEGAFWNTLRGFHLHWDHIDVICPFAARPKSLGLFGNVTFHPLPKGRMLAPVRVLRAGLEAAAASPPDLIAVHAYGLQLMSWGGLALATRLRCPFVVEVHHIEGVPRAAEPRDHLRRLATFAFLRSVRRRARAFRIVNAAEMPEVLRRLGIPSERTRILYSVYLDHSVFRPSSEAAKDFDVIFVGRLVPNKGIQLLLEAFDRLRERIPSARFLIVGQGPQQELVDRARLRNPGLHHVPRVETSEDLARAYNSARVVVCASSAEGGPRYVVEAMACGLPAVSTPVGLMKELVRDFETGFLTRQWSAAEIADAIARLLRDPDLYDYCAPRAELATQRFDHSRAIAEYAAAYHAMARS